MPGGQFWCEELFSPLQVTTRIEDVRDATGRSTDQFLSLCKVPDGRVTVNPDGSQCRSNLPREWMKLFIQDQWNLLNLFWGINLEEDIPFNVLVARSKSRLKLKIFNALAIKISVVPCTYQRTCRSQGIPPASLLTCQDVLLLAVVRKKSRN